MLVFEIKGRFMKNFRFDTIWNITQEPQLQRYTREFIDKSAVIRINVISRFDQLTMASFSTPP